MGTYVILDLEMCRVAKRNRDKFPFSRELIQIGAVAVNENHEIVDTFATFVKPEFGRVDDYIYNLTKITNDDVSDAPLAKEALEMLNSWLPEDATLVTWSENDVKQINRELLAKSIDIPEFSEFLDEYIDCQKIFSGKLNTTKIYSLAEALNLSCIDYKEDMHNALTDAYNTSLLFAKTQIESDIKLCPYYLTAEQYAMSRYDSFSRVYY